MDTNVDSGTVFFVLGEWETGADLIGERGGTR